MNKVFDIASAIVGVALATTLVAHPATASVIKSLSDGFSGSIRAAEGS